jgi:hypothetical protein
MMLDAVLKSLDSPDESRALGRGRVDVVKFGDGAVTRLTLEPGWKWSEDAKPTAGTDTCPAPHFLYQVSGRLVTKMADGREMEITPGSVAFLPPGHDAWVAGDEPVVLVDWADAPAPARA